jgi:adenylyltransferase/sulfurtransferase
MRWRSRSRSDVAQDPDCALCGVHRTITGLVDYEAFCGLTGGTMDAHAGIGRSAGDLASRLLYRGDELTVIDVRGRTVANPYTCEATLVRSARSRGSPSSTATADVLHCHAAARRAGLSVLRQAGFRKLKNLTGRIDAWSRTSTDRCPRYRTRVGPGVRDQAKRRPGDR